jgi:hypothetical protein
MQKLGFKIKNLFKKAPKILFLVRKSQKNFAQYSYNSSGLFNSANFVVKLLKENGVDAKLVEVDDANQIDKEIHTFKPDKVAIEAFWVTKEKFKEIFKLHPKVEFIVRNHSKAEFLVSEGIAFEWSIEYFKLGIKIACNSHQMVEAYHVILKSLHLDHTLAFYLPNYYFDESN